MAAAGHRPIYLMPDAPLLLVGQVGQRPAMLLCRGTAAAHRSTYQARADHSQHQG